MIAALGAQIGSFVQSFSRWALVVSREATASSKLVFVDAFELGTGALGPDLAGAWQAAVVVQVERVVVRVDVAFVVLAVVAVSLADLGGAAAFGGGGHRDDSSTRWTWWVFDERRARMVVADALEHLATLVVVDVLAHQVLVVVALGRRLLPVLVEHRSVSSKRECRVLSLECRGSRILCSNILEKKHSIARPISVRIGIGSFVLGRPCSLCT